MSGIFDQIINYSPPLIVSGTVNYKGTWDASANNPTLNSSPAASTKGDYYVVSTAGTQFGITFAIGDWIISNGTAWEKVDLTDAVSSVFGRTGAVVGVSTDYSAVGLTNTAIGAANPSTGAFTTITASSTIAATGAVTGSNLSGTNTGDQTTITGNAGSATVLQTPRAIYGNNFDGSAALTQVIASTYGGTGNGFAKFSGPASSEKTFTLPNASSTLLYEGGTIGATTANTGAFTTLSASGNLNFTGTGNRITGDFANATIANRVAFQNSTANSATVINALPSGTGTASGFVAYNNSDPTNAALMRIFNTGTEGAIQSGINGTGSYLPMTFYTGGSERMRIDTSGNVGIGTASPARKLTVSIAVADTDPANQASTHALSLENTNTTNNNAIGISFSGFDSGATRRNVAGIFSNFSNRSAGGMSGTLSFYTKDGTGGNTERMTITPSGNVGIGTASPAAKLHISGTNAGIIFDRITTDVDPSGAQGSIWVKENGISNYEAMMFRATGYRWQSDDGTDRMLINSSGNVGIGTSSPATPLDVAGHVSIGAGSTSGFNFILKEYTTGTVRNWTMRDDGGVNRLRFSRGGTDAAFWDVLKVAASDQTGNQIWYTNGAERMQLSSTGLAVTGALSCTGALSKGSGSFRIEHPLPAKSATHQLVHSFIEGPQADLIYRGKVVLVDGKASVNIDAAATMTEGTFEVLCRDVQCFTTNETGWTAVRGKVTGNILTIESKDADCTDEISWMVIGERQDPHMMETDWTDDNGKVIVEPLKPVQPIE